MTTFNEIEPDLSTQARTLLGEARMLAKGCPEIDSAHVLLAALDVNLVVPEGSMQQYPTISALLQQETSDALRMALEERHAPESGSVVLPDALSSDLSSALQRAIDSRVGMKVTPASMILAILDPSSTGAGHDFNVVAASRRLKSAELRNELKKISEHEAFGNTEPILVPLRPYSPTSGHVYATRHSELMSSVIMALQNKVAGRTSGVILVWGAAGTTTEVMTKMLADGIADKTSALARALPKLTRVVEQSAAKLLQGRLERAAPRMREAIEAASNNTIFVLRNLEALRDDVHTGDPVRENVRRELITLLLDVESELVIAHYQTPDDSDPQVADLLGLTPASTIPDHPFGKQHTFFTIRDYYLNEWEKPGTAFFADIERPLNTPRTTPHRPDSHLHPDVQRMAAAFGLLFDLRDGIQYGGHHMVCPYSIINVVQDSAQRAKQGSRIMKNVAQSALSNINEEIRTLPVGEVGDHYKAHLEQARDLIVQVVHEDGVLEEDSSHRTRLHERHMIVELFSRVGEASFHLPARVPDVDDSDAIAQPQDDGHSAANANSGGKKASPIKPPTPR